ncbi:helix-turn-helix domain-containing protein [Tissierella sp. MSJ-40]|uniref:Helix-turn-helix domain-containing protein n=1 Tax=Tissierella simiarum TaxID=2841534 RepID=A0ABS6E0W1_9FIRM|nr:helix-turn-helix domain-containing protein [Tissierella simiarum]MBU5436429.1 helix-turn-helix domain-containing protein [Tissierella simiarum]
MKSKNDESISETVDILLKMENFYDAARIINPIKKQVVYCNSSTVENIQSICYDLWNLGTECENCISTRAIEENRTLTKIEFNEDKVFLIMASPMKDNNYVIEIIKDITDSSIKDLEIGNIKEVKNRFYEINDKIYIDQLTGVNNKKFMKEKLPYNIYNGYKLKEERTFIIVNIGFFNYIKNTYGEEVINNFVVKICSIIQSNIRNGYDWVIRYSEDEFIISIINGGKDVALRVIERIQDEAKQYALKHNRLYLDNILSFSICFVKLGCNDTPKIMYIKNKYHEKENTYPMKDTIVYISEMIQTYEKKFDKNIFPNIMDKKLAEILHYIYDNMKDVTLEKVARKFHFNPSYLSRLIKESTNRSFSEILKNARLKKSSLLLKNTDISISKISEEIGYKNPNRFYKVFKDKYGMTPGEYRNSIYNKEYSERQENA